MKALFFGTPDFSLPSLNALYSLTHDILVVTRPDAAAGRGMQQSASPIAQETEKLGLTMKKPEQLDDQQFLQEIQQWEPDVAVLAAYGKILQRNILDIPKKGFLNIHPSLLPRHRGASPIQHTILSGDTETGVTLMKMDEGVDTGPILARERIALTGNETFGELESMLADLGATLLKKNLPTYLIGMLHPHTQFDGDATTTHRLTKDDAQIDWSLPAIHVERTIRAFSPRPGAWTTWNEQPFKILRARLADRTTSLPPGTVFLSQEQCAVACGSRMAVILETVQTAGKNPMQTSAFLNGYPKFASAVFPLPKTQDTFLA